MLTYCNYPQKTPSPHWNESAGIWMKRSQCYHVNMVSVEVDLRAAVWCPSTCSWLYQNRCIKQINALMCQNVLQWNNFYYFIKTITNSAFFCLKNISRIEWLNASAEFRKTCPCVYFQLAQLLQRCPYRSIRQTRRDHISPVLRSLHWLPVCKRTDFKILLCVYIKP